MRGAHIVISSRVASIVHFANQHSDRDRSAPAAAARRGASAIDHSDVACQADEVSLWWRSKQPSIVTKQGQAPAGAWWTCTEMLTGCAGWARLTKNRTLDIAGQVVLTWEYRPPLPPEATVPCVCAYTKRSGNSIQVAQLPSKGQPAHGGAVSADCE